MAETATTTPAQTNPVQTATVQSTAAIPKVPYQVELTGVKILQDCIVATEKNPCILINLQVKNNNVRSLDIKLVKNEILGTNGKLLGNRYDREVGLSNLCVRQAGLEFNLNENTNKDVGLCYPMIHKTDNPALNVEGLINGERKTYGFDLTKYDIPD